MLQHLEQPLACATILSGGFEMKAKSISSEKKVRAFGKSVKQPMTDEQVMALMQRQLKRNHKTLNALSKL